MEIVWHLDDLKDSHKDPWVTKMAMFCLKFMAMSRCNIKKTEYLGMNLDYTSPGEVKISMIPYIDNILKDFSEEIVGTAVTPGAELLFEVQEGANSTQLPERQCIKFHTMCQNCCLFVIIIGMISKHKLHSS